jgi:hypothetical protein
VATIPAHFKVGDFSFTLVKEAVREFEQSKYEYEFEVFKGIRFGFVSLWFSPARPTELKGKVSYELRRGVPEEQRGNFCNSIFNFLKTDCLFKTYEFVWGDLEYVGPDA